MNIATAAVVCRVVDNYGDAGVCLRLARQLAAEHGIATTLWIDDPQRLQPIAPAGATARDGEAFGGVLLKQLQDHAGAPEPMPDLLVEAFGCGLPPDWLQALTRAPRPPVWIILEYLSAETWIDGAHALPSPHPRFPLPRWFWFPGFSAASGGLLRERGLLETRDEHQRDQGAVTAQWAALGLPPPSSGELTVSVFCYPNTAMPLLLDAWASGEAPVRAVFAEGVATEALARWAGRTCAKREPNTVGALTAVVAPFVPQDAFDRRLWCCDLNIVRGEDSFVRAQWAGKPLVWHIYPQAEGAHEVKLEAFLARYTTGLAAAIAAALRDFWTAFNAQDGPLAASAWPTFRAALPVLATHALHWADARALAPDLARELVNFARSRL